MAAKAKTAGNSPEVSFFRQGVGVSVFAQEATSKAGKKFTAYTASIRRRYVDERTGEIRWTPTLNERDWLVAASLLERAYWHVGNLRNEDNDEA